MDMRLAKLDILNTEVSISANNLYLIGRRCKEHPRSDGNRLLFDDKDLDVKHALILSTSDAIYVCDLDSMSGTYVNNKRLPILTKERLVGERVEVRFGSLEANFSVISTDEHHESSGYGESQKSSSFLEASSPIKTAAVFQKPAAVHNISCSDSNDDSRSNLIKEPSPRKATAKQSHQRASIFDDSLINSSKDSNDSCIPETQDVLPSSVQQENSSSKKTNTAHLEEKHAATQSNKENIPMLPNVFKLSTQEFNEHLGENDFNCSDLLEAAEFMSNAITAGDLSATEVEALSKSVEGSGAADASKLSDKSETMRLNWSEASVTKSNLPDEVNDLEELRANACTPDLFEFLEDGAVNALNSSPSKEIEAQAGVNSLNLNIALEKTAFVQKSHEDGQNEVFPTPQEDTVNSGNKDAHHAYDLEPTQMYIPKKAVVKFSEETKSAVKTTLSPIAESENLIETQIYQPKQSLPKPTTNNPIVGLIVEPRKSGSLTSNETGSFFNEKEKTAVEVEPLERAATASPGSRLQKSPQTPKTPKTPKMLKSPGIEKGIFREDPSEDVLHTTPAFLKKYFSNDAVPAREPRSTLESEVDSDLSAMGDSRSHERKVRSTDFDQLVVNISKVNQALVPSNVKADEMAVKEKPQRRQNYDICFGKSEESESSAKGYRGKKKPAAAESDTAEEPTTSKQSRQRGKPAKEAELSAVAEEPTTSRQSKQRHRPAQGAELSARVEEPTTSRQSKQRGRPPKKAELRDGKDKKGKEVTRSSEVGDEERAIPKRITRASSRTESEALDEEGPNQKTEQEMQVAKKAPRKRRTTIETPADVKPAKHARQTQALSGTSSVEQKNSSSGAHETGSQSKTSAELESVSAASSHKAVKRMDSTTSSSQTSDIDDYRRRLRVHVNENDAGPITSKRRASSDTRLKIAFTMVTEGMQKKIRSEASYRLWSVTNDPKACDVLIMDQGSRTFKFLLALARGIPIVNSSWLEHYRQTQSMQSVNAFLFHDKDFEGRHNFCLPESLIKARNRKIFSNCAFFTTPSIVPVPSDIKEILQHAGGKCCKEIADESMSQTDEVAIYLISDEKDRRSWHKYRRAHKGLIVTTTEGVMSAIMRQEKGMLDRCALTK